ncbi:oxidoreductase, short chain dehydrogenase/reductase family [Pusillimonas sp. T7-7]|uniref:SDR family NAD(P)-dependent oxidoreductase n=1 Tax=Pusillimonas sp. (strain T7-7) TaxID=1007105 RepID=UPI0002084F5A|nr:SDR family oxidoreductase [Pusillimonas sp. T7-7]AEC21214.1 oxidoreductase, short chain dehydrogenase/reductase family [Pusillimonas sp. T7-7]
MADVQRGRQQGFYADFPEGVAVVIGGSGGIGRAVSVRLAECGCDVALTFHKNTQAAQATADAIEAKGRRAITRQVDLLDTDAVSSFLTEVRAQFGRIHTLVVATGANIRMTYVADVTEQEWHDTIMNDVVGFFHAVKHVIPHMKDGGGGAIVALSSAAIVRHCPMDILSTGPKGSIEALVRAIAREEGRHNIRANSVGLGVIDAGLMDRVWEQLPTQAAEAMRKGVPLRRIGTADEAADAVVFLASSRSAFTTGQRLVLDGGYST